MRTFARVVSNWVYHLILSYVQNVEDAEEITQDVVLAALRGLKNYQQAASLKTWVYRIAINKSKDFLKYKNRKKRLGKVVSIFSSDNQSILHQGVDFVHPGIALEHQEDVIRLMKTIDRLAEHQKTALILVKLEHKTQKEVAAIMQLTPKAVEGLVSRAKNNLRRLLKDEIEQ
ncbi:MAG: RNA polymerase sigma factor [Bacteroidota bacterium]